MEGYDWVLMSSCADYVYCFWMGEENSLVVQYCLLIIYYLTTRRSTIFTNYVSNT